MDEALMATKEKRKRQTATRREALLSAALWLAGQVHARAMTVAELACEEEWGSKSFVACKHEVDRGMQLLHQLTHARRVPQLQAAIADALTYMRPRRVSPAVTRAVLH